MRSPGREPALTSHAAPRGWPTPTDRLLVLLLPSGGSRHHATVVAATPGLGPGRGYRSPHGGAATRAAARGRCHRGARRRSRRTGDRRAAHRRGPRAARSGRVRGGRRPRWLGGATGANHDGDDGERSGGAHTKVVNDDQPAQAEAEAASRTSAPTRSRPRLRRLSGLLALEVPEMHRITEVVNALAVPAEQGVSSRAREDRSGRGQSRAGSRTAFLLGAPYP